MSHIVLIRLTPFSHLFSFDFFFLLTFYCLIAFLRHHRHLDSTFTEHKGVGECFPFPLKSLQSFFFPYLIVPVVVLVLLIQISLFSSGTLFQKEDIAQNEHTN